MNVERYWSPVLIAFGINFIGEVTAMLEGLDRIAWDQLSHAYGPAGDVPDQLRRLASDQKEVWEEAIGDLFGNIWHQGTVYEATAYAVPFLIDLLGDPTVVCKPAILFLLQSLAGGNSYLEVHQSMDWYHNERKTEEFQAQRERELGWVRAAHDAVVAGTDVYLKLLTHTEDAVRGMASYLLACCLERARQIEPVLAGTIATESSPVVKASLLMSLTHLWWLERESPHARVAEQLDFLSPHWINRDESASVRLVAALSTVKVGGEVVIERMWPVFRETVDNCGDAFAEMPWFQGGTPIYEISGTLASYPQLRFRWLSEMLGHGNPEIRKSAIWETGRLCREWRWAPEVAIPVLVKLVADPVADVRQAAASDLPRLGKARSIAVPELEQMLHHPDSSIGNLAAKTLDQVRNREDLFSLGRWLKQGDVDKNASELIAIVEQKGSSKLGADQVDIQDAIAALEFIEPAAWDAVSILRTALSHDYHWVRVRAARALWKITQQTEDVLPVLLEELQCRPAGILVADCLGSMGRKAEAAIPTLRRIIDSERRLVKIGSDDDWIDEDEGFCEAARQALVRIEVDAKRPP